MNKTNSPTNKRLLLVAVAILVALIIWGLFYYFLQKPSQDVSQNYAKEVAAGMEQALLKEGATKACEGGDAGRIADNRRPRHEAYFEIPLDRNKAIEVIQRVATDNNFSLTHASPTNKGPLSVPDIYIDNWFYDHSRPSYVQELQQGQIELNFVVINSGDFTLSNLFCNTEEGITVHNNTERSAIKIEVRLPEFKR